MHDASSTLRIDHFLWGVAGSAALALFGHGMSLWVLMEVVLGPHGDYWWLAIRTVVLPAAPFLSLLIALLLARLLRWSPLFPWGLLAVPWLAYESAGGFITGTQPVLAGWIPVGALVGGIGDLLLVLLLVSGAVVWWKQR